MKPETLRLITLALDGDCTVSAADRARILSDCAGTAIPKKDMISGRQAMEILCVSRPTLLRYVKSGLLTQVRISCRKIRYDRHEVLHLAEHGANSA